MDWVAGYHHAIDAVLGFTGWPDKLVHVHVGLAIFLVVRLLLPGRRGAFVALAAVIAAETFNEVMDRLFAGSWHWPDTRGDIAATLFWPTLLVLAESWRRWRETRAFEASGPESPGAEPALAGAP